MHPQYTADTDPRARADASVLYSGPTAADLACIPATLTTRHQWILWRGVDRVDVKTGVVTLNKIPIDPRSLRNADTTDPLTWGTYQQCRDALPVALEGWEHDFPATYRGGGLGFVFTDDDPYTGIDLDKCRDEATGTIEPWALTRIRQLDSYTEVTPSGTGVHVLVEGSLPPHGRKKGHVEMYNTMRFFTVTGWHVQDTPRTIEARQEALTAFHHAIFPQKSRHNPPTDISTQALTLDDVTLLDKARVAKNSPKFIGLWAGDTSLYNDDDSSADLALCCLLAFWTQDVEQLDRLFRQSRLMRDKWDDKRGESTYGQRTIAEALARQTTHYTPRSPRARTSDGLEAARDRNDSRSPRARTSDPTAPLEPRKNPASSASTSDTPARPEIYITTEISRVTNEAQDALLTLAEAPVIFQRSRQLCMIAHGTPPPKWLHRPHDMPVIIEATAAHLIERAVQAADWYKFDKRVNDWVATLPPGWLIPTLQGRPSWPFPVLEGIVTSPTLRLDGSVLDTPGYDTDTGLFLDTTGTTFPPLILRPTLDNARSAIGMLQEAVVNFPFAQPWHFSTALAAMLSLVCRFAINGNVPLFAIRANTRASGKSLLGDVISIIGTGRAAPRWPQASDPEEERKRLLTVALQGYSCVHIDNIVRPLGSPALDMALTASTYSDRLLGTNEAREAPLTMIWLASGNNMQFQGDTARRIVPIDLDPKMERPEERTDFQHSPLLPWLHQERPRLTIAALTIIQAYFTAGCPTQGLTPMGSFEAWSDLIRQALVWAGEDDPNEGRKSIEAESNPEYERLAVLLDAWTRCYPKGGAWTLAQVKGDIHIGHNPRPAPPNEWNDLHDALGAYDPKFDDKNFNTRTVGDAFRAFQGRTIGGRRFVGAGKSHQAQLWQVEQV